MAKAAEPPKSKMQVVREILAKGITKNAEIVAAAKEQGVSLTPGTVANYKHHLGASKSRKRGRRRGAKKSVSAKLVRTAAAPATSDLELENLALRLIIRAGSAAKARQLIDRVG